METNIGVLRYCFQYAITQELRLGFDWVSFGFRLGFVCLFSMADEAIISFARFQFAGRQTVTHVPSPLADSNSTVPPRRRITFLARKTPSPIPSPGALVV